MFQEMQERIASDAVVQRAALARGIELGLEQWVRRAPRQSCVRCVMDDGTDPVDRGTLLRLIEMDLAIMDSIEHLVGRGSLVTAVAQEMCQGIMPRQGHVGP